MQADELVRAAETLEALAYELRDLALDVEMEGSCPGEKTGLTVGDRVMVVTKDKYYGCTGTVSRRRGVMYWYVLLDERDGAASKEIYKMGTSLRIVT